LSNVLVRDRLPVELQFVGSSVGGQVSGNEITWNLGTLQGGETKTIKLSTKCLAITPAAVQMAMVTADGGLRKEAQASLEIFGAEGLRLEMRDSRDPVEVGKRNAYIINVTNKGTAAANQVVIKGVVPLQMKIIQAKGASAQNVQGQVVTFAPVNVAPGQTLEFTIECEALQKGDAIFRVEMGSPTLQPPVFEEEITRIIE
jgi:uncharacterized repeat protein (TIGR01451 family)